ncbi:2OG-Fe(II) oxygenase [Aestuariibacter salexigens]|uniref:2OG-Fe(II) oxygenase n=1 Tax=Aestuariibacter salexigens TaxID=226010 RepID=UPI0004143BB3|nr:2OG-Fe(II) oxygenase [Aestuariibacter salexigens]
MSTLHATDLTLPVGNDSSESIANELAFQGYSIRHNLIPRPLLLALSQHAKTMHDGLFHQAGVGREASHTVNQFVRSDSIKWIEDECLVTHQWLEWAEELKSSLNRHAFLGLQSFESHFAHYAPGAFYKPHVDAFKGQTNRKISLVTYLNEGWLQQDGGQLRLHLEQGPLDISPMLGTVVCFLSEEIVHEVLPATRDRYSIAGWFRQGTLLG